MAADPDHNRKVRLNILTERLSLVLDDHARRLSENPPCHARLSIVIPLCGTIDLLEGSLVGVLENRPDDCQVIVVLNDAYDDPYDLHDEVTFVEAPLGAGPVACLNLGIAAASAPIVHVLACGGGGYTRLD